jgi:hypothetical protein
MSYPLSRLMSAATATYGGYALYEPRHLGRALTSNPVEQSSYDTLAYTYGARDLTVSALGVFGSERTVRTAMTVRIVCDVADGLILSARAGDDDTRVRVLGVTLGWASLNTLALLIDRRRAKRHRGLTVVV